ASLRVKHFGRATTSSLPTRPRATTDTVVGRARVGARKPDLQSDVRTHRRDLVAGAERYLSPGVRPFTFEESPRSDAVAAFEMHESFGHGVTGALDHNQKIGAARANDHPNV